MALYKPTVIVRHRRENLKKCSLRGLEGREDMLFFRYPLQTPLPSLEGYLLLSLEGPPLSPEDACKGIILIDGTWRHSQTMKASLLKTHPFPTRSLPSEWRTAYPRRQEDCQDPARGLASIEALFAAYTLLRRDTEGLLEHYFWKNLFIAKNKLKIV